MSLVASRGGARAALALVVASVVGGCDLAPLYHPPAPILPASYAGQGPFGPAVPADRVPRGDWWAIFHDPELDRLERSLDANNPTLAAAAESYTQARDAVAEARAGLFPSLSANAQSSDNRQSQQRLFRSNDHTPNIEASNELEAQAAWEPDFWYRIRNETRSAKAVAQATAANLATARLSLEAELASDYMALRGLDAQIAVYARSISTYRTAVTITSMRFADKIAPAIDQQRAENQLASAEAAATDIAASRGVLVDAIAVLAGVNPGTLAITVAGGAGLMPVEDVPVVPVGVPSALLQRRPDIAAAERRMAAANAQIGVARAAFYPNVDVSALVGLQSDGVDLFTLPNSLWAVGASAMLPLFEGGLRRAELQQNWSRLAQAADDYRATVLAALQQVQDDLILSGTLRGEAAEDRAAETAARRVQTMSMALYTGGVTDFLDVTVAQIAALTAEIAAVEVHTRRLEATIDLVRALGGGWSVGDLPTPEQTVPFSPLG